MNIFLHTMILSYFINQIFNIEEVGVAKSVVAKSELCGVYNKQYLTLNIELINL